jgi:hypothetical protein
MFFVSCVTMRHIPGLYIKWRPSHIAVTSQVRASAMLISTLGDKEITGWNDL